MTAAPASGNDPLAGHVRLIRAAADLIEQAGIPGLTLFPWPDEIVIQVPEASGDAPSRTGKVARLAAIAGCEPAHGPAGQVHARGCFAGCPVRIWAPVSQEEAP
jgi:hypothetical protein